MEKHPPLPMTPFDMLTSSTQLQMMKLMLPYTPPGIQRMLAFYIKFLELKKTAEYFGLFGSVSQRDTFSKSSASVTEILEDVRPYLGKDAETIDMLLSAMSMMDMMKDMDMPDFSGADMGDLSGVMQMMNAFQNTSESEDHSNEDQEGEDENDPGMAEPPGDERY